MPRRADFFIFAARFYRPGRFVETVKAFPDDNGTFDASIEIHRTNIIHAIERRVVFQTLIATLDGRYIEGERLFIFEWEKIKYVKTIHDGKPHDDLGDLPEF